MSAEFPRTPYEQLPPGVKARLSSKVERLGYLGEFFQCAAVQAELLETFIDFTDAAKDSLPSNIIELVALTAAGFYGNDYERNQHQRLSVRMGLGRDWVRDVCQLEPGKPSTLREEERVLQSFLLSYFSSAGRAEPQLKVDLIHFIGHDGLMAVMLTAGRYVVHAMIVNCLELAPPVPSIFEDGFGNE